MVSAKRLGFLTGAAVAAAGVYAFYALTAVSDDDRLTDVLRDHCLPFVTTGAEPFQDLGRSPGVYDDVNLRDTIEDGGARLIYDNRFTAQWGTVTGAGKTSRICNVNPTYGEATVAAFEVAADGFVARYTAVFEGLTPSTDTVDSGPTVMSWRQPDAAMGEGLRIAMTVSPGLVSGVSVVDDLDD